jgi:CheY-like chemotaxis protein
VTSEQPLILVVEDEPKMRRLLRVTLESNNMRYAEAVTAREALSQAQSQRPDVVAIWLGCAANSKSIPRSRCIC